MTELKIRPITTNDAQILFDWVNSPSGLSSKLKTVDIISYDTHIAWLKERFSDTNTGIWIAEIGNRPVGQVRMQLIDGEMDIDVFVVPEQRRKGVAEKLLEYADAAGKTTWPNKSLVARIRHENVRSTNLFSKCDYELSQVRDEHIVMVRRPETDWWKNSRNIRIVVDNPSWIIPYVEILAEDIKKSGDRVEVVGTYDSSRSADVTFLIGCVNLAPRDFLNSSKLTLVVHESGLPSGRGFSPLTWSILEGKNSVPICLIYAVGSADAGPVVYRENLAFEGHELIEEMRILQGKKTIELCKRYLDEDKPTLGELQMGEPTYYRRRTSKDSKLDISQSLADQFDLLRTVDNDRYPAYFHFREYTYTLEIKKRDRIV